MTITPNKWELDVQGYLNVCNITAATPRKQIRDFSAGVNDLGLWNSMVCWPLRSTQNYGSGTTAFSLGGLGTYNGVLTNGPTWEVDGIALDGVDDFITASPLVENQGMAFGFVNDCDSSQADNAAAALSESGATPTELRFRPTGNFIIHSNSAWGAGYSPNFSISGRGFYCLNFSKTNSTAIVSRNLTFAPAQNRTLVGSTSNRAILGSNGISQATLGAFAFWFYIKTEVSSSSVSAFYSLYKSTLGTGLGLP